ncbi:hypothetical protein [Lactococcus allomyrinae]|uniref:hypothetical protein n=1 Tax=Lactococcus allomyrinae TaxID=2419773 RepID=UPI0013C42F69|nr:hypothetical protein [Lactococcus allomyrinae]
MKKIIIASLLSLTSLTLLSACGNSLKKTSQSKNEKTEQLSPNVKDKGTSKTKNTLNGGTIQTAPKVSSSSKQVATTKPSSSSESVADKEAQNKKIVTEFFADYLTFNTSTMPAYQRAENMLKLSNEKVVNYLMPNVLANGNNVRESINYTQSYISPIIIKNSSQAQYQYDVTVEYKTSIAGNDNQTKEMYSLSLQNGKVSVIKKDVTWIWNPSTKSYQ